MPFPPAERRLAALRKAIKEANLEGAVFRDRSNIKYFCGFSGSHGWLVVPARGNAQLVTDGRYGEIAEGQSSGVKISIQPNTKDVDDWFKKFFAKLGLASYGFEDACTYEMYKSLRKYAKKCKLKRANELGRKLRMVKDEGEIAAMQKAAAMADGMMVLAHKNLRPGIGEHELSKLIRRGCEDMGAQGEAFENIVASGPNSSRPHHHDGRRTIRKGDAVTIDLGARLGGYCSDLTRNPFVGKVSRKLEDIYNTVLQANEAAIRATAPGIKCIDLDGIAREVIASAGYGEFFAHGLGHGVGLDIHEGPGVNQRSKDTLEEGMVFTIEPGVYVPGVGGVRIEDLVVVSGGKARVLSAAPKALTVVG